MVPTASIKNLRKASMIAVSSTLILPKVGTQVQAQVETWAEEASVEASVEDSVEDSTEDSHKQAQSHSKPPSLLTIKLSL